MGKKSEKPKSWKKWVTGTVAVAAVGTGALGVSRLPYFVGETVTEVIDGDTFFIANHQSIRLAGIDAPELGRCGSEEAKKTLVKMIAGKTVVLRQPVSLGGRISALVYQNGKLINAELLKQGLVTYRWDGGVEKQEMKHAYNLARDNSLGIFGPACTQIDPPSPGCAIKGNWDENQDGKKVYILPSCDYYSQVKILMYQGDEWLCSEAQARKAGYTKSSSCLR